MAKKILGAVFIILLGCFWGADYSKAAEFTLQTSKEGLMGVGEAFQTDLLLNTQMEKINAISGKIIFFPASFKLTEIRAGNSIINFWVESPAERNAGEINFSGIIPGGYNGDKGLLLSLIFATKKEGQAILKMQEGQALLNDGQGTAAQVTLATLNLAVSNKISTSSTVSVLEDSNPPESFKPEIGQDPALYGNQWFVVFVTQDKGVGVDHYEIQETRNGKIIESNWQKAESPYLIKDQSLRSYINIKAVDKNNNYCLAMVVPQLSLWMRYEKIIISGIIILLLGIFYYLGGKLWSSRKGKKRN